MGEPLATSEGFLFFLYAALCPTDNLPAAEETGPTDLI